MANNDEQKHTDNSQSEDTISLEALVLESDASSPPGGAVEKIDEILEVEDPAFTAELREMREQSTEKVEAEITTDAEIESTVAREKAELGSRGPKKLFVFLVKRPLRRVKQLILSVKSFGTWLKVSGRPALIVGLKQALNGLKAGLLYLVGKLKAVLGAFGSLPLKSKALVALVAAFGGLAVTMTLVAYKGDYLPSLEKNFLLNFSSVAGEKFEIGKDAQWVDLNDPMLHPEHIVLIERIIANLKPPGDGTNPMALIDLYLEAGSQESAVEIKNRESEARDVIGRTLEQMTYEELIEDAGKNKLKVFVRKSLNDFLTSGRIRRVFFKSIVLKP